MKSRRTPSWDASGLVEKAWKRLDPPTRDRLAEKLGLGAATNISKLNTGELPMTLDYAKRIARVVPGITVADLGAPSKVVAEQDPTALARLKALEAETDQIRALLRATFRTLKLEVVPGVDGGDPTVRRIPPRRGQRGSAGQP